MNVDPINHSTALLFVRYRVLMACFDICLFSWDLGDFFQPAGGVVSQPGRQVRHVHPHPTAGLVAHQPGGHQVLVHTQLQLHQRRFELFFPRHPMTSRF